MGCKTTGSWTKELEGADVVVNLCGKSVDCRYNPKNRQEIFDSRINSTRALGLAIQNSKQPPALWINLASATIYRHSEDTNMDEGNGEIGSGFSVEVCKRWEKEFFFHSNGSTRQVALRTAMVLGTEGGVLKKMKFFAKLGLGGKYANGKQFLSWIHETDFIRVIEWMIENKSASGIYNAAAPEPMQDWEFGLNVRHAVNRNFGLNKPEWLLKIGAFFLGTETELVLKSRRVVPGRLLYEGFRFKFNQADEAIKNLAHSSPVARKEYPKILPTSHSSIEHRIV